MQSSRPSALPDWSAVPSDSEDDRRFLNLRLAYFGALAFFVSTSMAGVRLGVGAIVGSSVLAQLHRLQKHPGTCPLTGG